MAIVQHAIHNGIQFVGKSGGHSSWSNIGAGWVIDFVKMREVKLNMDMKTVCVGPGVDAKTLNVELARSEYSAFLCYERSSAKVGAHSHVS